ncbi:MAG: amino acid decarboxylase, partial [Gammaproteobacteria bacterium]|nr:amino acid decarboxylase [Gammaproteobacteria bacterium]
ALRAWMALKTEGVQRYRKQIEQNIRQAAYLDDLVRRQPDLELLAPTALNIVNFRFRHASIPPSELDDFNAELLMRLHEQGVAAPSSTMLNDSFSIRVAICNHRSRRADFDALIAGVLSIGRDMLGENGQQRR